MDPITLLVALITAGEKAVTLARALAEAKKKADSEDREMTAAEMAPFREAAHTAVDNLDQLLKDAGG